MTSEEKARLEQLDRVLRSDAVRGQIAPVISRVCAELKQKSESVMTWEPVPLEAFGSRLPEEIRSGWVFVLRAGTDTGVERHPNSHQRMMSAHGSGDMRTEQDGEWRSNVLISESIAPLEQRWVSIPPNVWHRPVTAKDADWVVVSFHTVPAEELIEERPGAGVGDSTKQMRYLDKRES
jgi:hypothetical protein